MPIVKYMLLECPIRAPHPQMGRPDWTLLTTSVSQLALSDMYVAIRQVQEYSECAPSSKESLVCCALNMALKCPIGFVALYDSVAEGGGVDGLPPVIITIMPFARQPYLLYGEGLSHFNPDKNRWGKFCNKICPQLPPEIHIAIGEDRDRTQG
jgi:hypothetical protein